MAEAGCVKVMLELKKAVAAVEDPSALREQLESTNVTAPTLERFMIHGCTFEKLGGLLAENPNGLLRFRDELVGWSRTLDREGHEGERARYERGISSAAHLRGHRRTRCDQHWGKPVHDGVPLLRFTSEAQVTFDEWLTALAPRLRSSEERPAFVGHLAKYRSLIPALALLFHIANGALADKFTGRDVYRRGWGGLTEPEDVLFSSHADQAEHHRATVARLNARKEKLASSVDQAYTDRLEGRIPQELWDRRSA